MIGRSCPYAVTLRGESLEDLVRWLEAREAEQRKKKRKLRVAGGSSHDGAQRRGGDKAPGAGIRDPRNRHPKHRGEPSNGPDIQGENHHPLFQGENQEATSPPSATEKEATEVSKDYNYRDLNQISHRQHSWSHWKNFVCVTITQFIHFAIIINIENIENWFSCGFE